MNQLPSRFGDIRSTNRSEAGPRSDDFEAAQSELFESVNLDVTSHLVDLDEPRVRLHIFEAVSRDDGVPLLFVHGGGAFGAFLAPLMAQLDDHHLIGFDRPGYGLSGDFRYTEANLRRTAVDVLEGVLDRMGIQQVDLVGHSMGGYATVQFALARPDRVRRLILIGACAGFPGATPPVVLRLMTVPVLRRVLQRMGKPGEAGVLDVAEVFGEREAIQAYPALIQAMVAETRDPKSSETMLSEFAAFFSVFGWHRSIPLHDDELAGIQQPTLAIWGENDPIGSPEDFRPGVDVIPDASVETILAAHAPFLSYPELCAEYIQAFRGEKRAVRG
ncbi:alpha/beta fold hydrolase [Halorarius litoreus]|uniref:alpha/beta fold hydrolase n=1 Tax=Halorarius litoreus TaxID=2962676 RepID=UPI0020CF8C7E|nr:alpha/beta hydrolase [Halorarius litoreus]